MGRRSARQLEFLARYSSGMLQILFQFFEKRAVLDVLLIVTKLLGTLFAGAFGVLGLVTEYRDKRSKKITKWGRLALGGIVVSTVIAITSQAIETVLSKQDAKDTNDKLAEQLKVSNNTLNEVERSIFPIKNLIVGYSMEIPIQSQDFVRYQERVKAGIQHIDLVRGQGDNQFGVAIAGGPGYTVIQLGPALLPRKDDGLVYALFQEQGLAVSLYRAPFDLNGYFQGDPTKRRRPDLSFTVEPFALQPRTIEVTYTVPSGRLCFEVTQYAVAHWDGDDRIASVPDLSEAELLAFPLTPDLGSSSGGLAARSPFDGLHVLTMSIQTGDRTFRMGRFDYRESFSMAVLPKLGSAPPTP